MGPSSSAVEDDCRDLGRATRPHPKYLPTTEGFHFWRGSPGSVLRVRPARRLRPHEEAPRSARARGRGSAPRRGLAFARGDLGYPEYAGWRRTWGLPGTSLESFRTAGIREAPRVTEDSAPPRPVRFSGGCSEGAQPISSLGLCPRTERGYPASSCLRGSQASVSLRVASPRETFDWRRT
jgi:hypothetical protein